MLMWCHVQLMWGQNLNYLEIPSQHIMLSLQGRKGNLLDSAIVRSDIQTRGEGIKHPDITELGIQD